MNDTTIIEIIDLHPYEINLIKSIRYIWRFGNVTIQTKDGLPFRLMRVYEFIDLTKSFDRQLIDYSADTFIPNATGVDIVEKEEYNITN